jgi:hypothetical protein
MPWNHELRAALFENLEYFRMRYAFVSVNGRSDTLLLNPNAPGTGHLDDGLQEALMRVVSRITELGPNAVAHDSPGFAINPRPHIVISRVATQDGRMDGQTRICVYYREGQFHIAFRCQRTEDIGGVPDFDVREQKFGIDPHVFDELGRLQWTRRAGGHVSVPVDAVGPNFPQGSVLEAGHPVASLVSAMNERIFLQPNPTWDGYCAQHNLDAQGVKVPRGHFPPAGGEVGGGGGGGGGGGARNGGGEIVAMNLNTILYGPPGTGKTFATLGLALSRFYPDASIQAYARACQAGDLARVPNQESWSQWLADFDQLRRDGRIEFTTFHQNYAYEDFIEGIRASTVGNAVAYSTEPGVFKRIAYRALYAWLNGEPCPVGGPEEEAAVRSVREWLSEGFAKGQANGIGEMSHPYVLVIDEINRGNMARIMGELITLVEDSKRARSEPGLGDQPLTATLPYTREPFIVPPNLYILGTMNTADRSLVGLDVALRRRFSFVELAPRPDALPINVEGVNLQAFLRIINERIEESLDSDHLIGHAFFLPARSLADLAHAMEHKVIPQLREYFHDRHDLLRTILLRADGTACDFILFRGQSSSTRLVRVLQENLDRVESYRGVIGNAGAA